MAALAALAGLGWLAIFNTIYYSIRCSISARGHTPDLN